MKKAHVFIDGHYLSLVAKSLGFGPDRKYDIKKLCENISEENSLKCSNVYYYTAPPFQDRISTEDQDRRKSRHDNFVRALRETGIILREGRTQRIDGVYKQKGVDTLITMDLMREVFERKSSSIIVITSDTDFAPVLEEITKVGVETILYCYSEKSRERKFSTPNHLVGVCNKFRNLTEEHLEKSKGKIE